MYLLIGPLLLFNSLRVSILDLRSGKHTSKSVPPSMEVFCCCAKDDVGEEVLVPVGDAFTKTELHDTFTTEEAAGASMANSVQPKEGSVLVEAFVTQEAVGDSIKKAHAEDLGVNTGCEIKTLGDSLAKARDSSADIGAQAVPILISPDAKAAPAPKAFVSETLANDKIEGSAEELGVKPGCDMKDTANSIPKARDGAVAEPLSYPGFHEVSLSFKVAEILVIVAMPFLYGAATRLPFIYFVIHLDDHFDLDWWTIGLYVACYQGTRVVTSAVSIYVPKLSHTMGTSVGLAGFITVFVSDKDLLAPFVTGTAIVGFSETMSSMQQYAKEMYKLHPDRKKAQLMLKCQYASVMIGVVFAFSIGGFVYQYHKINGVAVFGIMIEGSALLVLFLYLCLPDKVLTVTGAGIGFDAQEKEAPGLDHLAKNPATEEGVKPLRLTGLTTSQQVQKFMTWKMTESQGHRMQQKGNATTRDPSNSAGASWIGSATPSWVGSLSASKWIDSLAASKFVSSIPTLSMLVKTASASYSSRDLPATWVNWILCISFGIEALTIGYNLSIGPIFLLNEFNQGTGIIGVLFAVGAASGSIAAIGMTCTTFGIKLLKLIAASPFDVCFSMGGIAVGVLVAAVPNFVWHVIGLVLLMCFNDLGATLLTELQASVTTASNYSVLGPLGQVIRRSLNVVTALTGPILFGVHRRLPYLVAGIITLSWTVVLFVFFRRRVEKTVEQLSTITGRSKESVKTRCSFSTAEIVSQGSDKSINTFNTSSSL